MCSRLIYYLRLFNIESKRPRCSDRHQKKYLNKQLDKLQYYFNDSLEFYEYFRRNSDFLDEQYFLRGKADIRLYPETYHFFSDGKFSTSHDGAVARILAHDMIIIYLKTEIDKLRRSKRKKYLKNTEVPSSNLCWSGSKTDLVEIIYALQASGALRNGQAEISRIANVCSNLFEIDLGNVYKTYSEIKSREIDRTKFIDKLKVSLETRMNYDDSK